MGVLYARVAGAWVPVGAGADPFIGFGGAQPAQSVGVGAQPALIWATEAFDSHGFHAASSTDIIIPAGLGGTYSISFTGGCAVNVTSPCVITINRTGSTTSIWLAYIITGTQQVTLTTVAPLVAGDLVQCKVHNANAATQNFNGGINLIRIAA